MRVVRQEWESVPVIPLSGAEAWGIWHRKTLMIALTA